MSLSKEDANLKALAPIVIGCADTALTADEKSLFADRPPAGLILFRRNCVSKNQVSDLVASFRELVKWADAPVLIDQEGGSVARLIAPEWTEFPPAGDFAAQAEDDLEQACDAVYQNAFAMARELAEIGVTVNCAPVMDVPSPECHDFLSGSRTYGTDAHQVTELAEHVCRGLLAAGVTPVMKHIPGHGRGTSDSHKELPKVTAELAALKEIDFAPFRTLSKSDLGNAVWAMGAHIVYTALDADNAATISGKVIGEAIRGSIGFTGVVIADDIGMEALSGTLAERAVQTLQAGCDLTLHCSGDFDEMRRIFAVLPEISSLSLERILRAEELRHEFMADAETQTERGMVG